MAKTESKILKLLEKEITPSELANKLNISRQAVHRHLKKLLENKQILKTGSGPHIKYIAINISSISNVETSFQLFKDHFLTQYTKKNNKEILKNAKKYISSNKKDQNPKFEFLLESAAVYSSNIEGNSLNLNSFLNSRQIPRIHRPKEAQEIEDLIKAYEFSKNHNFNEKNMLRAHGLLSRDFVTKSRQGKYREEPVGVYSKKGLEYLAVESHLIQNEIKIFFKKVEHLLTQNLEITEIIFWASWIHLTIALIHPFSDGNGRIARLCEKWFLKEKLGKQIFHLPSEEYYFKNRPKYYSSLKLGLNYWEVDFKKAMPFTELLAESFKYTTN